MSSFFSGSYSMPDAYHIKGSNGSWALIYLQEGIDRPWGALSIISDYGNFGCLWTAIGERPFRSFLASLDFDYAMQKLSGGGEWKEFDAQKSTLQLQRKACRMRRDGELSAKHARELFDAAEQAARCSLVLAEYHAFIRDRCPLLVDFVDIPIEMRATGQCVGLWRFIWPKLLEAFKEEEQLI